MVLKRQKIGLGTRKLKGESAIGTIKTALQLGYRTIDTAWIYQNAAEIHQAIHEIGIPRSELWITTKTWFDYLPNYEKHDFIKSDFSYFLWEERFHEHLQALGVGYVDEVLIHWPSREENDFALLTLLASYQKQGLIKNIGVSNFPLHYLQKLRDHLPYELSTNQIELHLCLLDPAMLSFAKEKNLTLTAYSPLGHGHLLKNPIICSIAQKHNVSPAQIAIARCLRQGASVLVKASTEKRLLENLQAETVVLDIEDLALIETLPKHHRYNNPPFAPRRN